MECWQKRYMGNWIHNNRSHNRCTGFDLELSRFYHDKLKIIKTSNTNILVIYNNRTKRNMTCNVFVRPLFDNIYKYGTILSLQRTLQKKTLFFHYQDNEIAVFVWKIFLYSLFFNVLPKNRLTISWNKLSKELGFFIL